MTGAQLIELPRGTLEQLSLRKCAAALSVIVVDVHIQVDNCALVVKQDETSREDSGCTQYKISRNHLLILIIFSCQLRKEFRRHVGRCAVWCWNAGVGLLGR